MLKFLDKKLKGVGGTIFSEIVTIVEKIVHSVLALHQSNFFSVLFVSKVPRQLKLFEYISIGVFEFLNPALGEHGLLVLPRLLIEDVV